MLIAGGIALPAQAAVSDIVELPDVALLACVNEAINESYTPAQTRPLDEPVAQGELNRVKRLYCLDRGIASLAGLEAAEQLDEVTLGKNALTDVSQLLQSSTIRSLFLNDNPGLFAGGLPDFSALGALDFLNVSGTGVSDLTPLGGLSSLESLFIQDNAVSDLAPLAALTELQNLDFSGNQVYSVDALSGLSQLNLVMGNGNHVIDVSGLQIPDTGVMQLVNQTRALQPVRVGESVPNPVRDLGGNPVPPWLTEVVAGAPDAPVIMGGAAAEGTTPVVPSEDGSSWTYTEVGAHEVRWHQYPCEDTISCYFDGVLQQTAYDFGISEDLSVVEGASATFTSWMDFPGAEPSAQWQVSTDGGLTWENVADATADELALSGTTVGQSGSQYRVLWTVEGVAEPIIGEVAGLTVRADTTTPPGEGDGDGDGDGDGEGDGDGDGGTTTPDGGDTGTPGTKPGVSSVSPGNVNGRLAQTGATPAGGWWAAGMILAAGAVMLTRGMVRSRK